MVVATSFEAGEQYALIDDVNKVERRFTTS
jgi:hypothetical protein